MQSCWTKSSKAKQSIFLASEKNDPMKANQNRIVVRANSLTYFLLTMILFASCGSTSSFTYQANAGGLQQHIKVNLPKGYRTEIQSGGEGGSTTNFFIYTDSSIFCIADFYNSPNSENIRRSGQNNWALLNPDTITFSGTDQNDNYWKE